MSDGRAASKINWPKPEQFNDAIQSLSTSMSDEELRGGTATVNSLGLPILYSGGFADVYEVHCPSTNNTWAVKCFKQGASGLRERYRKVSDLLDSRSLPFTVGFEYQEEGILIEGKWYPIVKMQWVEGKTLNEFVSGTLNEPNMLDQLFKLWVKLAARLHQESIAHADLQHGNVILVPKDDQGRLLLKLIDYDGMWTEKLAGSPSGELGHANYQHPQRKAGQINSLDVDRFSHLVICCALRCLYVGGQKLWTPFDNGENLLFVENDFQNAAGSRLFQELWAIRDRDAHSLVGHLVVATKSDLEDVPHLHELIDDQSHVKELTQDQEREVRAILNRRATTVVDAGLLELTRQIEEAVLHKQFDGLLPIVDRYLAMQSQDNQMQALRDRLHERERHTARQVASIVERSKELRRRCKFGEAAESLQRIPETFQSDEIVLLSHECVALQLHRDWVLKRLRAATTQPTTIEKCRKAIILSKPYEDRISIDPNLQDVEYQKSLESCHVTMAMIEQQQRTSENREKRWKMCVAAGVIGVAALFVLMLGLWLRSSLHHQSIVDALTNHRYEHAVTLDPENVAALTGLAKSKLAAKDSDPESIQELITRLESLNANANTVNELKSQAHAIRSIAACKSNKFAIAEIEYSLAAKLSKSHTETLAEARTLLAEHYLRDAANASEKNDQLALFGKANAFGADTKHLVTDVHREATQELLLNQSYFDNQQSFSDLLSTIEGAGEFDLEVGPFKAAAWLKRARYLAGTPEATATPSQFDEAVEAFRIAQQRGARIGDELSQLANKRSQFLREKGQISEAQSILNDPAFGISTEIATQGMDDISRQNLNLAIVRGDRSSFLKEVFYLARTNSGSWGVKDLAEQLADICLSEKTLLESLKQELDGSPDQVLRQFADVADSFFHDSIEAHATSYSFTYTPKGSRITSHAELVIRPNVGASRIQTSFDASNDGTISLDAILDIGWSFDLNSSNSTDDRRHSVNRQQVVFFTYNVGQSQWSFLAMDALPAHLVSEMAERLSHWSTSSADAIQQAFGAEIFLKEVMNRNRGRIWIDGTDMMAMEFKAIPGLPPNLEFLSTEVTQSQFAFVMEDNPSRHPSAQSPVVSISPQDAMEFCSRLSRMPREQINRYAYRIPLQSEWETACRGGTKTNWHFGGNSSTLDKYAWTLKSAVKTPQPVGKKTPNQFGLHDTLGNVSELCIDDSADENRQDYWQRQVNNTFTLAPQVPYVALGGGWLSNARDCAAKSRDDFNGPSGRVGIRIVRVKPLGN